MVVSDLPAIGDLFEWRDPDDDEYSLPRMGVVRGIGKDGVSLRVSGVIDPCAPETLGEGWSAWVNEPDREIKPGMWIHLLGDDCYVERIIGEMPVIWYKRVGAWRCESYRAEENTEWEPVNPPPNAAELLALLGVEGDGQ